MKKIKILIYTIFCIIVSAECIELIRFYSQTGEVFYLRKEIPLEGEKKNALSSTTNFRLHPFFGFILKPGITLRNYLSPERVKRLYEFSEEPTWLDLATNNNGFFALHDYPYTPRQEEYLIGIFGGSLAHWFAVQGSEKLEFFLQDLSNIKGRKIKILNFAAGGYKQPQQLLVLNYFLALGQKFDLVINIDGFNELALSDKNMQNGVDALMPSSQHLSPFSEILRKSHFESKSISAMAELLTLREQVAKYAVQRDASILAAQHLLYDLLVLWTTRHLNESRTNFDSLLNQPSEESMLWLNPSSIEGDFSKVIERLVEHWYESSILMQKQLKDKSISYLHVLQPNQYFSSKSFSPEEEILARGGTSPYNKSAIETGYPLMQRNGKRLLDKGIMFYDSTNVLNNEKGITFSDNCCHLNQLGNEILAKGLSDQIKFYLAR